MSENKYQTLHIPVSADDLMDGTERKYLRLLKKVAQLEREKRELLDENERRREQSPERTAVPGWKTVILVRIVVVAAILLGGIGVTVWRWRSTADMGAKVMATEYSKGDTDVWGNTGLERNQIRSVIFKDTLSGVPEDAWDVSETGNGCVMAWVEQDGDGSYDLYAAGEGGVTAGISCAFLFYGFTNLTEIQWNDSFITSGVTKMYAMFGECGSLTSLDFSGVDTSNTTDMGFLFYHCSSLTSLDLSEFDTSHAKAMDSMFSGCSSLPSLDLSGFDTSWVTTMRAMFVNCGSLTELDLSGFDTSYVTDMGLMFQNCGNLSTLDVSSFDTSYVTDMSQMFTGCSSLTSLDLVDFRTQYVTDMSYMFYNCSSLAELDLSGFDTSGADTTNMTYGVDNVIQ